MDMGAFSCDFIPEDLLNDIDSAIRASETKLTQYKTNRDHASSDGSYWHWNSIWSKQFLIHQCLRYFKQFGRLPTLRVHPDKIFKDAVQMDAASYLEGEGMRLSRLIAEAQGEELFTCRECGNKFLLQELNLCAMCGQLFDAVTSGCICFYWGAIPLHCGDSRGDYDKLAAAYIEYTRNINVSKYPQIVSTLKELKR